MGAKRRSFFTELSRQEVGVVVLLLLERLKVTFHVILSEYKKSELD